MKVTTKTGQELTIGPWVLDKHRDKIALAVREPRTGKSAGAVMNRIEWAAFVAAGNESFK